MKVLTPKVQTKHQKQRYLSSLIGAVLLSNWMLPALADGLAAGTPIDNTAYGSFESPAAVGTPIRIESNTVTITIKEIAGITVTTPNAPKEAPSGATDPTPGAGQGDGIIGVNDVVYFNYRITNTGNNATQFFIPGVPQSVTNGTFDATKYGRIKIVGYAPNGTAPVTPLNIFVPTAGATTGSLSAGGDNNGSIPAGGYIDIQVPVKINSALAVGSQVSVVMGDTPTVGDQNIAYDNMPSGKDIYTVDNNDANDDFPGIPIPEREASARQNTTIGLASLDYGDAPDTGGATGPGNYLTTPGRGPSHVIKAGLYLGTGVDAETEAFQDNTIPPLEDNGVKLVGGTQTTLQNESLTSGQSYTLEVTVVGSGYLSAWIDFNQNGVFEDSEKVSPGNVLLASGTVAVPFSVPTGASGGVTYARFRYSSAVGLTSTSAASDGEVEDYKINLIARNPALKLVKRITKVGTTIFNTFNDGPGSDDNAFNWPTNYPNGAITADAEPGQEVEYTIYFLSDGNTPVNNVRLCDLIPDNTTYKPGSLKLSQGGVERALTDIDTDADAGYSFDSSVTPVPPSCQGTNDNGGVYVTIPGPLNNATASGIPASSYGYIRFTVTVK